MTRAFILGEHLHEWRFDMDEARHGYMVCDACGTIDVRWLRG